MNNKKMLKAMKSKSLLTLLLLFSLFSSSCANQHKIAKQAPFIMNIEALEENKIKIESGDEFLKHSLSRLVGESDKILNSRNRSVVEKKRLPPSGNLHDYLSMATYYWPDPKKANGEPYIHKDGQVNPEIEEVKDNTNLIFMVNQVNTLALTFFYTNNEKYAQKAIDKLSVWFLNEDTKMNPNLNHSQYIPGRNDGRSVGIIDTRDLVDLIDGLQILSNSDSWNSSVDKGMKKWFAEFSNWLQTSELGKNVVETQKNNIATAYCMQIIAYSLYSGDSEAVKKVVEYDIPKLVNMQIDNTGRQVLELKRANAWRYSESNLGYWLKIARLVEHVDVNLLDDRTHVGKALLAAYNWMQPFALQTKEWDYNTVTENNIRASAHRLQTARTRLNRVRRTSEVSDNGNIHDTQSIKLRSLEIKSGLATPYEILSAFN